MVTRNQQPGQQPGALTVSAVLDLTRRTAHDEAARASNLATAPQWVRTVVVWVGHVEPVELDPRVPGFLADAIQAGISIQLEGDIVAVAAWRREIHHASEPRRHLTAVR